ncbi:universal stress protein [Alloscardovia criceti]|uniref:universal stress protein n=1 Tax=Alloscardovia criceti TaxID=356828 RepID=UPI00035F1040|nr:universal stress protein [Alloscardovia criceti]
MTKLAENMPLPLTAHEDSPQHSVLEELGELAVGVDGTPESFAALQWAMQESAITHQKVHAIYGWTQSWDTGAQPISEADWDHARKIINHQLSAWAQTASESLGFDVSELKLTSMHSAGTTALLNIGENAHQIVVGRRSMGAVARWFLGSSSQTLINEAQTPVTIVRMPESAPRVVNSADASFAVDTSAPVVVGVDGSVHSLRALNFALEAGAIEHRDVHVILCWQTKTLGEFMEKSRSIPSLHEGEIIAQDVLSRLLDQAHKPAGVSIIATPMYATATKGLLSVAPQAHRVIVGSRGLGKFEQQVLGSVSKKLLEKCPTTVTVVH